MDLTPKGVGGHFQWRHDAHYNDNLNNDTWNDDTELKLKTFSSTTLSLMTSSITK
jgi:hypothetical protein